MAAVLLTPLGEHFVRVELAGENGFAATNTTLGDTVQLLLREDNTLDQVQVTCLNPDSGQKQLFSLRLSEEQTPVDGVMFPHKIQAFWDDKPYYEVAPVHIENLTSIADEVFTLETGLGAEGQA